MLLPLDNYGGLTETHALDPESPAINIIPPEQCGQEFDQRGKPRPNGGGCDIGALEND
jgi:hypothetical protein